MTEYIQLLGKHSVSDSIHNLDWHSVLVRVGIAAAIIIVAGLVLTRRK